MKKARFVLLTCVSARLRGRRAYGKRNGAGRLLKSDSDRCVPPLSGGQSVKRVRESLPIARWRLSF